MEVPTVPSLVSVIWDRAAHRAQKTVHLYFIKDTNEKLDEEIHRMRSERS